MAEKVDPSATLRASGECGLRPNAFLAATKPMIGKRLGHYRIVEKIGAGGMGEVYRAWDEHLERDVAIKVLPTGTLADDAARKRFRKEALALSKLNHPNIQTVHDFDTQDGVDFLVVEFVPGLTLADKLASGPLPEKEVAWLGSQIAAALEEAHERGVVHRDLKPGNVKVTPKGQVNVLDFGLAKLLRPFNAAARTETFTETQAAGTLPYMAPEQLRGEPLDTRSDLWAAGAVLYELATGKRAFPEELTPRLTDTILHGSPVAPRALNPRVSTELERIIVKCLEKEPENRYQSAGELVVDLRRLAAPAEVSPRHEPRGSVRWVVQRVGLGIVALAVVLALLVGLNVGGLRERVSRTLGTDAPKIDSLAVLPLKNLMGDAEQEYFVEGMHEALTAELSKISALKVISRTSAMRYKDTDKAMPQIARELGVEALIEGSLLRESDQVRITVQLIHGPSDRHLWAQSFDRELRGILALHSEVARAIAREIKVVVTPAEQTRLAAARPVNPEAHELYLKGVYHWNKVSKEGLEKAIEYFEKAIAADANHADAYAMLADSYGALAWLGHLPPKEACARANTDLRKALEIDDSLAEAHRVLGNARLYCEWDWPGAEKEYQRAIELNPSLAAAHSFYALYLYALGRFEEAIAEAKRALELDPLSVLANLSLGDAYLHARRYDRAIAQYQGTVELEPNDPRPYSSLAEAYKQKGMYEEAVRAEQKAMTLSGAGLEDVAALGRAYREGGPRAYRMWRLERARHSDDPFPLSMAAIYAELGDENEAFVWLEKAYQQRAMKLVFLRVSPRWDPLRDDPRFQAMLRRMNFPE